MLPGSAAPAAGDVECGTVVDRGPDDGQAQRHVHRLAERQQLDRDQPLIVVAGDHDVELAPMRPDEHGVARQRAATR